MPSERRDGQDRADRKVHLASRTTVLVAEVDETAIRLLRERKGEEETLETCEEGVGPLLLPREEANEYHCLLRLLDVESGSVRVFFFKRRRNYRRDRPPSHHPYPPHHVSASPSKKFSEGRYHGVPSLEIHTTNPGRGSMSHSSAVK